MTPADHHRAVAGRFTDVVDGVTDWSAPTPVPEWSTRAVVGHLVEWLPALLASDDVLLPPGPSVADDPAAAWHHHAAAVQTLLDADDAARPFTHQHLGTRPLDEAIDRFYTGDVFLHTWDLARASGQDDRLDPATCAEMLAGMEPIEELMRSSGQYGPSVPVPDDADVQDRLLGFIGRDPSWRP